MSVFYRWQITIKSKTGGAKATYYIGQDSCPISEFKFELNQHGCGSATVTFDYFDIPIDCQDEFFIYFQGTLKYRGYVDVIPDPKGGDVELLPIWKRLETISSLPSQSYAGNSSVNNSDVIPDVDLLIIQQIINHVYPYTGIINDYTNLYQPILGVAPPRTFIFKSDDKAIDWLDEAVAELNRYSLSKYFWYLTVDNILYCDINNSLVDVYYYQYGYTPPRSKVKTAQNQINLFNSDLCAFESIEVVVDYSTVKATRAQVYKKTASAAVYVDRVGCDAGTYPPLPIENIVGTKMANITINNTTDSTAALVFAYALLQTYNPTTCIKVKGINLDNYFPSIFDYLTIEDNEDYILKTISTCDTDDGWLYNQIDLVNYVEGIGSHYLRIGGGYDSNDTFNFNNTGNGLTLLRPTKSIAFMWMGNNATDTLVVTIKYGNNYLPGSTSAGYDNAGYWNEGDLTGSATTIQTITNTFLVETINQWNLISIPFVATNVYNITFAIGSGIPGSIINIDRIQIFQMTKNIYQSNVCQANFEISPEGEKVDMKLNNYDIMVNSTLKELSGLVNGITATISN